MSLNATHLGADPSCVRRVLQMSGLSARSTSRQKRSGNAAALLARKVARAGNEVAILIAFTFYLFIYAANAGLVIERASHIPYY